MLVSAPKTPENEENGAAIRSRRWCDRRPQSGICLRSLEEVSPAERTRTWARPTSVSHECHSYSGGELSLPLQNAYFIRHSFQAEGIGSRALAVIANDGFHNPWDAYFGEELQTISTRG